MSVPGGYCNASAIWYEDGVPVPGHDFDFEYDCDTGKYSTSGGGQHHIEWDGANWIYSDPFDETFVGGTDPDDAGGTYYGETYTIEVTMEEGSCSCCDSSCSDSGLSSGSGKYSSIPESSASSPSSALSSEVSDSESGLSSGGSEIL